MWRSPAAAVGEPAATAGGGEGRGEWGGGLAALGFGSPESPKEDDADVGGDHI